MTDRIELDTGVLSLGELKAILESLPADCTFADADNVTRFYTKRYRIFDRRPEHIGINVVDCHSADTRVRVAQLLSELATGWRDEAVFLTHKDGRPVNVRYLPVRDGDGAYLGVLEIAQWADEFTT
jgi:DUF438 domain-containing protein